MFLPVEKKNGAKSFWILENSWARVMDRVLRLRERELEQEAESSWRLTAVHRAAGSRDASQQKGREGYIFFFYNGELF